MTKKITDKMRLDWLLAHCIIYEDPSEEDTDVINTRNQIDSAMKSEAKHEEK
jgi:hypothetical protein